jgi:hypothetical protein
MVLKTANYESRVTLPVGTGTRCLPKDVTCYQYANSVGNKLHYVVSNDSINADTERTEAIFNEHKIVVG